MNYAKITFPEKRGESYVGFANFNIYMPRPDSFVIEDIKGKQGSFHFSGVKIQKVSIRHWLIIEFTGYLYNDKKRAYDFIDCEIKIDDVKELTDLIDKKR